MQYKIENIYGLARFAIEKHPFIFLFSLIFLGSIYFGSVFIQSDYAANLLNSNKNEQEIEMLQEKIQELEKTIKELEKENTIQTKKSEAIRTLNLIKKEKDTKEKMMEKYKREKESLEQELQKRIETDSLEKISEKN